MKPTRQLGNWAAGHPSVQPWVNHNYIMARLKHHHYPGSVCIYRDVSVLVCSMLRLAPTAHYDLGISLKINTRHRACTFRNKIYSVLV